jgi:ribosomal protein L11 methyltransferase
MTMHALTVETTRERAERLATALEACDVPAVAAITLFETANGRCEVQALYDDTPDAAILAELVGRDTEASPLRIARLVEQDWVRLSQAARAPVVAGRFLVHGPHDQALVEGRPLCIEIDAGLAFGTAHHASTKGCLLALDRVLRHRRPKHIADVGTGSGILAIAAAKVLHGPVLASDSDPLAVRVARDNARLNGVGALVRPFLATGVSGSAYRRMRGRTCLLLANLLLRPLWDLAPAIGRQMRRGGAVVLSGITVDQCGCIEARYRAFGFRLHRRYEIDSWSTLVLFRR